jgi:uncharacterized protein (TIGR02271 family)
MKGGGTVGQRTTVEQLQESVGAPVYASDGAKVGSVDEIFFDNDTGEPEWLGVGKGIFKTKRVLVPLTGASAKDGAYHVPYSKEQIESSPDIQGDEISQETEAALYAHYGLPYSERRSDSGLPEAGPGVDTSTGDAMTRSEEELQVGKTTREAGRARLRKYVVSEDVTETVPVEREQVRVEREPITNANVDEATGKDISEDVVEVPVMEEDVVAEKRVVPKERVRLGKDTVTEEKQVSEQLRKEEIEQEGDVRP